MIAEKIRLLRKQAGFSQEQLAEKLCVSRQAVTKWETGAGMPDIENLQAISCLFSVSLDDLLESNTGSILKVREHLYESITEYDMECEKHYDISFSGAKQVSFLGYNGEKIKVRLASDLILDIQSSIKVKIDDMKKRIDITIKRFGTLTESKMKEALYITIWFPQKYTKQIEMTGNTESLFIQQLEIDDFEFSGKLHTVKTEGVSGHIELDSNEDIEVHCCTLNGRIDINQISATSKIYIPQDTPFVSVVRGIGNHVFYEKSGVSCDDFSIQGDEAKACGNRIELNGMNSELMISTFVQ